MWQRTVHALLDRVNCVFVMCWWGAGGVCQHMECCDGYTQARSSTVVERLFLFVVEHRCLCVLVVLLFVAMDGMSTWIGGLLDHVIEMVFVVLKEFSWCCSNVRATGRNGDTAWCVFEGVPSGHCCLLLIHTHGGAGAVVVVDDNEH